MTLPVALAVVKNENKILLIKRDVPPFLGLWSLPGGKIEKGEHISEAAVREIKEEIGIETKFEKMLGVVSENLHEYDNTHHFLLFVCELSTLSINMKNLCARETIQDGRWFDLESIDKIKSDTTPSDFMMIKQMVSENKGNNFISVIEKIGDKYNLKLFESV